jgi:hypothetical protein
LWLIEEVTMLASANEHEPDRHVDEEDPATFTMGAEVDGREHGPGAEVSSSFSLYCGSKG